MFINVSNYQTIQQELAKSSVTLIAVSKTKPVAAIQELYNLGHRDFGENYVQELVEKAAVLPQDIRWHFIGHLQTNKVKYIAPIVHLIHSVDSEKLFIEINKQASKHNKTINCLLQVYIAKEETKYGLDEVEVLKFLNKHYDCPYVNVKGLMGMASFTSNESVIHNEFATISKIQKQVLRKDYKASILSIGMSSDYKIALKYGSTMVRIGSLIFGQRNNTNAN